MTFSERYGYTKARDVVQLESMDDALRNSLWSVLTNFVWKEVHTSSTGTAYVSERSNVPHYNLCVALWFRFFKLPLDEIPNKWGQVLAWLKPYFFNCKWYEVYDFVEFVASNYGV